MKKKKIGVMMTHKEVDKNRDKAMIAAKQIEKIIREGEFTPVEAYGILESAKLRVFSISVASATKEYFKILQEQPRGVS